MHWRKWLLNTLLGVRRENGTIVEQLPAASLTKQELIARKREYYEQPGFFLKLFYTALFGSVIFGVVYAAYYIYIYVKRHQTAKNTTALINVLNPRPAVGQTLTCRIRFRTKVGQPIPSDSPLFHDLNQHISIIIKKDGNPHRPIAILKEVSFTNNHIIGKFSLRKSGSYKITVKYERFDIGTTEPYIFGVNPGPPFHDNIDFGTHNPNVLCVTAGFPQYLKLLVEDQYGNPCQAHDIEAEQIKFELSQMGNPMETDYELICQDYQTGPKEISAAEIYIKIKVDDPGVYHCTLKYDGKEVGDDWKLLVCISRTEEEFLRAAFTRQILPGLPIYSCGCMVSLTGDAKLSKLYAGVLPRSIVFASNHWTLMFYPDERFPINGKTKLVLHESRHVNSETEVVTFVLQDGLRQPVHLELEPPCARMLLITHAHAQGFVLPKLASSFQDKKKTLTSQMSSYFADYFFSGIKSLNFQSGHAVKSSMPGVPKKQDEWLLPFKISRDGNPFPTTEWLNILSEELFIKCGETGLFHSLPDSKLLHINSATHSRQSLGLYRFAGQVLGKAIVEALLRHACTRMSNVRFTRSLLAFMLGYPIQYKYLEADEPRFFRKIVRVLESDVQNEGLTFTTLSASPSDTNTVNLIRDGSDQPVTNENKHHYVNLLSRHRLIHSVEQEISAFRAGFYDVIDKDYLCNFNEHDLQMLISGGCEFNIDDLKKHYRVVKEVDAGFITTATKPPINKAKILNWFWNAVQNMSEKEHSSLIFFATGSFSLPTCGMADLSPPFTINLTGTFNQPPKGHPKSNEIVLSDHVSYDSFERALLYAIKSESERLLMSPEEKLAVPLDDFFDEVLHDGQHDNHSDTAVHPAHFPETRHEGVIQQQHQQDDQFLSWIRTQINGMIN